MFGRAIRQSLIVVHRWLGVALSFVFLVWFLSGIGLMYWGFPSVRDRDRLERAPVLDASRIRISPYDAAARVGANQWAPVLLTTFDARPAYRFGGRRESSIVYADTGEQQHELSKAVVDRIASTWSGQPVAIARVEPIDEVDQWTGCCRSRSSSFGSTTSSERDSTLIQRPHVSLRATARMGGSTVGCTTGCIL